MLALILGSVISISLLIRNFWILRDVYLKNQSIYLELAKTFEGISTQDEVNKQQIKAMKVFSKTFTNENIVFYISIVQILLIIILFCLPIVNAENTPINMMH